MRPPPRAASCRAPALPPAQARFGARPAGRAPRLAALGAVCLLSACAADLRSAVKTDDGGLDSGGPVDTEAVGGGDTGDLPVYQTRLDATSEERWVSLDLDAEAAGRAPEAGAWELQAQRYVLQLNGGVSGEGGVQIAIVEGAELEELDAETLDALPGSAWITDAADADADGLPEYALADWYDYDSGTHTLSPKPRAYGLRSTEGSLFAFVIDGYYDEAGTSGHLSLRWGPR